MKIPVFFILIAIFPFGFSNCKSPKNGAEAVSFSQNPPFVLTEVYFQKWAAGTKEGGSGINLHFTITDKVENLSINEVFFRGEKAVAIPTQENSYIAQFKNKNGDVIMASDPAKEAANLPPKFPGLADNEAVLIYEFEGETRYYKISEIQEKPMLAYPGSKP